MMNKKLPVIHETRIELHIAMHREPSPKIAHRIQALYLIKTHQVTTRSTLAAMLGVDRTTIGDWLARYEQAGFQALCTIQTHPNRPRAIVGFVWNALENRLDHPDGFAGYGAIRQWLHDRFGLQIPYKTVYKTVHDDLHARPKVPRKSNIKKDPAAQTAFMQQDFARQLQTVATSRSPTPPIRVFAQDESRFGLMTGMKRRITAKGVKPIGPYQHRFENYYLYGAIAPDTGDDFYLELPHLDTACFQVFLTKLSHAFPDSLNILLLDRGTFHRAKALVLPPNIRLIFQPAHSPEVNPIERLWEYLKDQIASEIFETLEQLKQRVAHVLRNLSRQRIQSLTGFTYFLRAVHAIMQ